MWLMILLTCSGYHESIKENLFGVSRGEHVMCFLRKLIRCPRWGHSRKRNQFVQRHGCVRIVREFNFVGVWVPSGMVADEVGKADYGS